MRVDAGKAEGFERVFAVGPALFAVDAGLQPYIFEGAFDTVAVHSPMNDGDRLEKIDLGIGAD